MNKQAITTNEVTKKVLEEKASAKEKKVEKKNNSPLPRKHSLQKLTFL